MQVLYLIKDELTEEELDNVRLNTALLPALGAIVTTGKGVRVAIDCHLDYLPRFNKPFNEVEAEALRISDESGKPVVIIGHFDEPLKEICLKAPELPLLT